MTRKKKVLIGGASALALLVVSALLAPRLYCAHATRELTRQLDQRHGREGWVAVWVVSDGQTEERIHLYRTIYLRRLYPKFLSYTPYKELQFTHDAGWANTPPHYAVLIYTADGEHAYRWSMKEDEWYTAYENPIDTLPPWEKGKILGALDALERVDGLNVPRGGS